jgi:hypothetical protein
MSSKILHPLAVELPKLYNDSSDAKRKRTRLIHILRTEFRPEDMSDAENQIVWTGIVLLSLQCGMTTVDYLDQVGVTDMQLLQWTNGVSMPQGSTWKKDITKTIIDLMSVKQSSG